MPPFAQMGKGVCTAQPAAIDGEGVVRRNAQAKGRRWIEMEFSCRDGEFAVGIRLNSLGVIESFIFCAD